MVLRNFASAKDHERIAQLDLTRGALRLVQIQFAASRRNLYQEVGALLCHEGWAGLITRSAARPEAFVVCAFADAWPPDGCMPRRTIHINEVPPPPTGMVT